ncbi:MAG: sulfite exporter TauE/SafE family protein [Novosphingobium sp.]|nr:sulfite exporter TauE/SafE family protein [Novosphingobium sp.]
MAVAGGVLLGLASSLHCAGMCGPIAASLTWATAPASRFGGGERLLYLQAGKALAYLVAGAIVGHLGSLTFGWLDREQGFRVLQWAAAASLTWVGLSTLGLLPPVAGIDRLLRRLASHIPVGTGAGLTAVLGHPVLAGFGWGLIPCGMVYAAIFTAALTGSGPSGALLMAGFPLGTMPAVTVAALGLTSARQIIRGPASRLTVGCGLVLVGPLSLALSLPGGPLCVTR